MRSETTYGMKREVEKERDGVLIRGKKQKFVEVYQQKLCQISFSF